MSNYDDLIPSAATATNYDDLIPAAATPAQPATPASPAMGDQGSRTDSFLRGFANSASFGVGKWVNALAEQTGIPAAAAEVIGGSTEPGKNRLQSAYDQLFPNKNNGKSFWSDIVGSVTQQKQDNTAAFNAHPGYYIAGAAAPAVVGAAGLARGAVTVGAAPTTFLGQVGTGAAVGAGTGATESTNLKELGTNVATGAVLGGTLSVIPAGLSAVVTKLGTANASKILDSAIADVQSGDEKLSQVALQKLHGLFVGDAKVTPKDLGLSKSTSWTERDLVDAATKAKAMLTDPDVQRAGFTSPELNAMKNEVVKTAPGLSQIGRDAYNAGVSALIPGAIGGMAEHSLLPGSNPIWGAAAGALYGARREVGTFAKDAIQSATMRGGLTAPAQAGFMVSPLAAGSASGQTVQPLGLSGSLGAYIDQTWRR